MQLDQVDAIYASFNAFTVLVSRPIVAGFRKRGKNRKQPSAPGFFGNKAAGHKGLKKASERQISVFPTLTKALRRSMRQNQNAPDTLHFYDRGTAG